MRIMTCDRNKAYGNVQDQEKLNHYSYLNYKLGKKDITAILLKKKINVF